MSTSKKPLRNDDQKYKGKKKRKMIEQEVSLLTALFKKMLSDQVTNTSFYEILGSKLHNNPLLFMHKIYPKIRKKFTKLLDYYTFMEFEKKIIKRISFLEEEHFIYEFKGQLMQKIEKNSSKIVLNDANIYFTNRRIIAESNGIEIHTTDTKIHTRSGDDYLKKYFISMILSRNLYHARPCFGYEFPILQLHDINRTRTQVEFTFYQGGTRMDCIIIPQSLLILKEIEKKLIELNNDDIPIEKRKTPCPECGNNIKLKHRFCKHCGYKIKNHDVKKESHYFF